MEGPVCPLHHASGTCCGNPSARSRRRWSAEGRTYVWCAAHSPGRIWGRASPGAREAGFLHRVAEPSRLRARTDMRGGTQTPTPRPWSSPDAGGWRRFPGALGLYRAPRARRDGPRSCDHCARLERSYRLPPGTPAHTAALVRHAPLRVYPPPQAPPEQAADNPGRGHGGDRPCTVHALYFRLRVPTT